MQIRLLERNGKRAFTLIELLVVILILAVLAALVMPRVIGRAGEAKRAKAKSDVATLIDAVQTYRLDTDQYPSTEEGLEALRVQPGDVDGWKGPYLRSAIPNDPWGSPYEYQYPGETGDMPTIISYGSDRAPGGDGEAEDISSDGLE